MNQQHIMLTNLEQAEHLTTYKQ